MNHVGTAASAVPPSRARLSATTLAQKQPNSLTPNSQTKQDFARRRDQPEYSCPEGERPPLLRSLPLGEGRVNGDARLNQTSSNTTRWRWLPHPPMLALPASVPTPVAPRSPPR